MIPPALPHNEKDRIKGLVSLDVLDTSPEKEFDDITFLTSSVCHTPMALISLIDEDRQWFKSYRGIDISETPRSVSICAHAINDPNDILEIEDTLNDERFHDNPMVIGQPEIRFYAGSPLVTPEGYALGTLCVIDIKPKRLSSEHRKALKALSDIVVRQILTKRENQKAYQLLSEIEQEKRAKQSLETKIKERTVELEAANQELEAFSYSVSHDLRAPLRSISGFSNALKDDYDDELAPAAQKYLERILKASARMGSLIDDLLSLSKISREHLSKEVLDISAICKEIIDLLAPSDKYSFLVDTGLQAFGDKKLIKIVLENLIANAIKYSSKKTDPVITIEAIEVNGKQTICIKDNGVGFDMAYSKKLFGAFQRLHSNAEFEGSGIGLATAQRIINKHGGKIWAESEPDAGARFYLLIGEKANE